MECSLKCKLDLSEQRGYRQKGAVVVIGRRIRLDEKYPFSCEGKKYIQQLLRKINTYATICLNVHSILSVTLYDQGVCR
jgi:hypothetical protein